MSYNAKEYEIKEQRQAGIVTKGIITKIEDGVVRNFLDKTALEKWDGAKDQKAIQVTVEGKYDGEEVKSDMIFTYTKVDDTMIVRAASNLGKYQKLYKKLPEVQDEVSLITNANGYFKVLID